MSELAIKETLYEMAFGRLFSAFSLSSGCISDEATILNLRYILEWPDLDLARRILEQATDSLNEKGSQLTLSNLGRDNRPGGEIKTQYGFLGPK